MVFFINQFLARVAFVCVAFSWACASDEEACSRFAYDHQMLDKIVKVEQKVELMDKKLDASLESFLAILQYRKQEIQTQFSNLGNSLAESLTSKLTRKVDAKLSELSQTEQLLADKISVLDGFINEHVDFSDKLTELETDIKEKIRAPKIAFSATNPSTLTYNTNDVLILRDIFLNEGSNYNSTTGEFTAPFSGLYLFSAHTCDHGQNWTAIAIVVGTKEIAHSAHYDQVTHVCSSVSALSNVQKGEKVFLRVTYATKLVTDSVRQSSFIGVLLSI